MNTVKAVRRDDTSWAIVFSSWMLSVVALVFAVAPIKRRVREGHGAAASP